MVFLIIGGSDPIIKGLDPATTLTFLIIGLDPIIRIDLGFHVLPK
jgi:hypothetical protein